MVKGRGKAQAHAISKSSGLKTIAKGVARRSPRTIARQTLRNPKCRRHVLDILGRDIQKEMTALCSNDSKSVLRESSLEALSSFTWDKLSSELSTRAPTFYAVLHACVNTKQKGNAPESKNWRSSKSAVLGMCAAIILRNCHHHMNLVQRIVSLILHSGHSAKQVSLNITCHSQCFHVHMNVRCTPNFRDCCLASLISGCWPTWTNLGRSMMLLH